MIILHFYIVNGSLCNLNALAVWLAVHIISFLYGVLMSPNKDEIALHCCDPALVQC